MFPYLGCDRATPMFPLSVSALYAFLRSQNIVLLVGCALNIVCAVCLVLLNKLLYNSFQFEYMVFLSSLHFVATALFMRLMLWCDWFTFKAATDVKSMWMLALGDVGSVAFFNLTLAHNTVGFYQLCKLMCLPTTILLQYLFQQKTISTSAKVAIGIILLGVGLATVYEVGMTVQGILFGAAAITFTASAHILIGSIQEDLGLDFLQLLYHSAPMVASGMLVLSPAFDTVFVSAPSAASAAPTIALTGTATITATHASSAKVPLLAYSWTLEVGILILLTCAFAIGVNLSNFMIIGRSSPVTYQVIGHFKTCLVLVLGVFLFRQPVQLQNVCGMFIAWLGMVLYTEVKRRESVMADKGITKKSDEGTEVALMAVHPAAEDIHPPGNESTERV